MSNAHGISGREAAVKLIVKIEITPDVDELGNLIATKNGERPSIMIEAHADEFGLMVMHIEAKGFIYFIKIGGWFDQALHS